MSEKLERIELPAWRVPPGCHPTRPALAEPKPDAPDPVIMRDGDIGPGAGHCRTADRPKLTIEQRRKMAEELRAAGCCVPEESKPGSKPAASGYVVGPVLSEEERRKLLSFFAQLQQKIEAEQKRLAQEQNLLPRELEQLPDFGAGAGPGDPPAWLWMMGGALLFAIIVMGVLIVATWN